MDFSTAFVLTTLMITLGITISSVFGPPSTAKPNLTKKDLIDRELARLHSEVDTDWTLAQISRLNDELIKMSDRETYDSDYQYPPPNLSKRPNRFFHKSSLRQELFTSLRRVLRAWNYRRLGFKFGGWIMKPLKAEIELTHREIFEALLSGKVIRCTVDEAIIKMNSRGNLERYSSGFRKWVECDLEQLSPSDELVIDSKGDRGDSTSVSDNGGKDE